MSVTANHRLSIVTVCLNSAETIGKTLESVKLQTYPDIEHIIIDGGSTDNTLQIIEGFSETVARVVSEKDKGIYDAMNKGISLATCDIIYFLNSDDYLYDKKVIEDVMMEFEKDPSLGLVYGDVFYKYAQGLKQRKFNRITRKNLIYTDLCHQCVFAKRELFKEFGEFDLRYRIAADYDWLLKIFYSGVRVHYLDRNIAVFDAEGEHSQNLENMRCDRSESQRKYQSNTRYFIGMILHRIKRKTRKILGILHG